MSAPILQVLSGAKAGTKYELKVDKIRLGRHPECEVVIDMNSASRYHAQMTFEGGQYLIEDLQSRNGTFVNGKKIEGRVALQENDRVKICDMLFVYRGSGTSGIGIPPAPEAQAKGQDDDGSTVLSAIDAQSSADIMVMVKPDVKLRAIIEISQAIGQTLSLDALFPKMLESLFKIFPNADRALVIMKEGNDTLVPRAFKHRRGGEDTIRFSKTIVRQAMQDRKAILSADASSDERFAMSQSIADFRIRSIMCVPLVAQNQSATGVIQIDTQSQNRGFTEEDLQLLVSVGSQASIAVENAKLHENVLTQERMDRELSTAQAVQRQFLPRSMPKIPGYEFWAYYEAAGQVGGDYYDFAKLLNGKVATIVGDVSGKGVPAALMMAKVSSDTKIALLTAPNDPAEAMATINNSVCEAGLEDRFITMVMAVLEPKTNAIEIVNAGHMSPIIRRANGQLDEPAGEEVTGLPVGVMEGFPYQSVTTSLEPGETLVLFTDGISEAMNLRNELYSIARLRQTIKSVNLTAAKLGEYLLKDVREHVAGHKQSDDMTMVVLARVS